VQAIQIDALVIGAGFSAAEAIFPDRPVQLQYTTTSPKLQQLLGLQKPA